MRKIWIGCLVATLSLSCHTHEHGDEHGHAHDDHGNHITPEEGELDPLVYTLYSEKTELFVEFTPLVVGQETRFAAHFTILGDSFKPIAEGAVSVSLVGGPARQTIVSDAPEVPGIFRLRLTPEKAGAYELVFDIQTPSYTDRIVIKDVRVFPDVGTALRNPPALGAEGDITYLKEQAWKVEFANMPVGRQAFSDVVRTSGLVTAAPGSEHTLVARAPGIVAFSDMRLMAGTPVQAGQALFVLSGKSLAAGNLELQLQEARIALEKARADYDRVEKLLADQLATQSRFQEVKALLEKAQARYQNLSENYGENGQTIVASKGGYIKSLLVAPGQYVEAGQPLAVISENKRLTVKAELSVTAFAKLGAIASANFRLGSKEVYALQELNGRLLSIGKFADNSMFVPLWFEIESRPGLIPGTYVEVFILTNPVAGALVIPLSAVLEEQGNYYCYVQVGGESFEKRELLLGSNDGKQVHVLSGLAEGERVVTKGAYNIKLSTASGTLPAHGHEH